MTIEQARPEREKAPPARAFGVVVFNNRGDVLLVRHKEPPNGTIGNVPGMYGIPSGIGERFKTSRINALEELEEETGIITIPEYLETFDGNKPQPAMIPRSRGPEREIALEAFLYTGPKNITVKKETLETVPEWVSREELDRLEQDDFLLPNVKALVHDAWRHSIHLSEQKASRLSSRVVGIEV